MNSDEAGSRFNSQLRFTHTRMLAPNYNVTIEPKRQANTEIYVVCWSVFCTYFGAAGEAPPVFLDTD